MRQGFFQTGIQACDLGRKLWLYVVSYRNIILTNCDNLQENQISFSFNRMWYYWYIYSLSWKLLPSPGFPPTQHLVSFPFPLFWFSGKDLGPEASISEKWGFVTEIIKSTDILPVYEIRSYYRYHIMVMVKSTSDWGKYHRVNVSHCGRIIQICKNFYSTLILEAK